MHKLNDFLRNVAKRTLRSGLPVPHPVRAAIRILYRLGVIAAEGLVLVRKIFWVEPVLRSVCSQVGHRLRAERLPYIRGHGEVSIGDDVNLSGRSSFFFVAVPGVTPRISVGNRTFIGDGCTLAAASTISIGNDCLISALVRIHDNDGHPLTPDRRHEPIGVDDVAAVTIGNNVWIGAAATILKGVTIGTNAIVATGAVITHDVPPNTVVAGNPARVVKTLERLDGGPIT